MDRDRAFYPAVLIAVASYYLAFAVVDGSIELMLPELMIAAVFIAAAVAGFERSACLAVIALAGHGVMDAFHPQLVQNAGVPVVWPAFCMSFDVTAAAFVALLMLAGREVSESKCIPFRTECAAMRSEAPFHSPLRVALCPLPRESS